MNYDQFLAQLQAAQTDDERAWLVMQFSLDNLPPALRQAVWAAAVPHWFDAAFLNALLDEPLDPALFNQLTGLSFVEPFPDRGYNVHERSRALLLCHLWPTDPARYRDLSRRAAAYAAQQDQTDPAWRVETVYHLLLADPDKGATQLDSLANEWHNEPNFAYDKVEVLARAGREHAAAGRLAAVGLRFTLYWEGVLDFVYNRYPAAEQKFQQIEITPETDRYLAAKKAQRLGDVERMLNNYAAARARYEEARPLYAAIGARLGQANCIKALGDVERMLNNYAAARTRYEEARPLYAAIGDRLGQANCIQALGDVERMLNNYAAAQARYEEARPLYAAIGARLGQANCIKALGDVERMLNNYAAARTRYEEARPLYVAIGDRLGQANCIRALGHVEEMLNNYAAAQARYEEARPLYAAIGDRLGQANCDLDRGDIARAEKNWAEAQRFFQTALNVYRDFGMPFNTGLALRRLGGVAEDRGDLAGAVKLYQQALEIFTPIGVEGDTDRTRADLERAQQAQANRQGRPGK